MALDSLSFFTVLSIQEGTPVQGSPGKAAQDLQPICTFQGSIITHMVLIGVEGGALSEDLIGELPRCRDPIGR